MNICVQGLWHLGSVTAACLASVGHRVIGLDFDAKTILDLKDGKPPILEPGLQELVLQGLAKENLQFTTDPKTATKDAEILWVTYDTPVNEDDQADVEFVTQQIEKTLPYLANGTIVLISSQMPVGSVQKLEALAQRNWPHLHIRFASSPENLRLGKSLEVFLKPDRIIVGVRSDLDQKKLGQMLLPITDRIEWMSVESAEMTKHAINAFLATSVTFANEIAAICELVGADAKQVEKGLKTENRIGPKAYLSPGGAFAGGTLARDIVFLNKISSQKNLTTPLLSSVKPSNDEHKDWVKRRLLRLFPDLSQAKVAIWGLTYKPGTNTLRRSLAMELCNWLIANGVEISVHDPAVENLPQETANKVTRCEKPLETLPDANVLVIATEWPIYREISADQIIGQAPGIAILDANRFLSTLSKDARIKYLAVGSPS